MIKENLRLILKNRLTWIIFAILVLFNFVYTFIDIYNCFKLHNGNSHEIINYTFLYNKPYAPTSWNEFFAKFSAFLFLVIPISLSFLFVKNNNYTKICDFRGKNIGQDISFALGVGIITSLSFFFNYFISILSFYLTMGFKMAPWKLAFHNGEIGLDGNYITPFDLKGYFGYNFYWSNNGNNTFLFFIIIALLFSFIIFLFIFTSSLFSSLFKNKIKFFAFIIFVYVYFFVTCMEIKGFKAVTNLVDLMKVHETTSTFFVRGILFHIIVLLSMAIIFIVIKKIIAYKKQ